MLPTFAPAWAASVATFNISGRGTGPCWSLASGVAELRQRAGLCPSWLTGRDLQQELMGPGHGMRFADKHMDLGWPVRADSGLQIPALADTAFLHGSL